MLELLILECYRLKSMKIVKDIFYNGWDYTKDNLSEETVLFEEI